MKKILFITQSKGGAGKSVLAFLLAEKYQDAIILDMDDATKTSCLQLAYRKPTQIPFLNEAKVIDRGLFNDFLEIISKSKNSLFLGDLGASVSEQLPYYFEEVGEFLPEILTELHIDLQVFCVVGGANIFVQTMSYLDSLYQAVKGSFKITVYKNEYYEFADIQNRELHDYVKDKQMIIKSFNISKDKNESTQNRIKEVLKSGQGIEKAKPFSKMYIQKAINLIEI